MKAPLITCILILFGLSLWSQSTYSHTCGADAFHNREIRLGHRTVEDLDAIDQDLALLASSSLRRPDTAHYILPLSFKIIHQNGPERISETDVLRSVDYLNAAFANTAPYDPATGVTIDISFCMATQDRYGRPSNGIEYISSSYAYQQGDDDPTQMMRQYHSPTDQVVNVYSVGSLHFGGAFGTFPQAREGDPVDGIVTGYNFLNAGPDEASVFAHEMGHYLGLYHTFQGGCRNQHCLLNGDRVCDTPPDNFDTIYEGCITTNNCDTDADDPSPENPFQSDVPDANHNYMDYNKPACYQAFTQGQRSRMRDVLRRYRPRLLASSQCGAPYTTDAGIFTTKGLFDYHHGDSLHPEVRIINRGTDPLQSLTIHTQLGDHRDTIHWTGYLNGGGSLTWIDLGAQACPEPGLHHFYITVHQPNGLLDPSPSDNYLGHAFAVPHRAHLPYTEGFERGLPSNTIRWEFMDERWELRTAPACDAPANTALTLVNGLYNEPTISRFITPWFDLGEQENPRLWFDHAFARQGELEFFEHLTIQAITLDNISEELFVYSGNNASLLEDIDTEATDPWVPAGCEDWTTESLDLSRFAGKQLFFEITTTLGRYDFERLYLDNFRISSETAEAKAEEGVVDSDISIFPNPTTNQVQLQIPLYRHTDIHYVLYGADGRRVLEASERQAFGDYQKSIDLTSLAAGVYFLRFDIDDRHFFRKVIKLKE